MIDGSNKVYSLLRFGGGGVGGEGGEGGEGWEVAYK